MSLLIVKSYPTDITTTSVVIKVITTIGLNSSSLACSGLEGMPFLIDLILHVIFTMETGYLRMLFPNSGP